MLVKRFRKMKTIAIVPTLNEEQGLPIVLAGLRKVGVDEIVVVDGNSTDRTQEIARKAGAKIILQEGKGKGNGFQSFLKKFPIKDEDFFVMLDGDASYAPEELPKFVEALQDNDVVAGNRKFYTKAARDFIHNIGNAAISLAGRILYWHDAPDICTGYWGFRGSALKKMRIDAQKFDLEADLYANACKNKLRFIFIPVSYRPRLGEGKLSFRDGLQITKRLISERLG